MEPQSARHDRRRPHGCSGETPERRRVRRCVTSIFPIFAATSGPAIPAAHRENRDWPAKEKYRAFLHR